MLPPIAFRASLLFWAVSLMLAPAAGAQTVEQYGVFETSITHDASHYENPFTEVDLDATFTAPSGQVIEFHGFYDGDGQGGNTGNVWKLRFMPEETGTYEYSWSFSDGSANGSGSFQVVASDRNPPLQVCQSDPRWLCYGGAGEPILLKSYYPTRTYNHDLEWAKSNIYQPLSDAGYNHFLLDTAPSHFDRSVTWGDYAGSNLDDRAVTNQTEPFDGTVNLSVWHAWDNHLALFSDLGVHTWFWCGIGGSSSQWADIDFAAMSSTNKEEWIEYWTARWAPYNIVAWGYWYESDADDEYWTLLRQHDPFDHLISSQWHPLGAGMDDQYLMDETDAAYTDWYPTSHAASWRYSDDGNPQALHDRILTDRSLQESMSGRTMPYYNAEGAQWTSMFGIDTTPEELSGVIWATITAGAYFNWNWATVCADDNPNCSSTDLLSGGYEPVVQVAYDILENVVPRWYELESMDHLLASDGEDGVWAMAEPGEQYLVFSEDGQSFELRIDPGSAGATYAPAWIDAQTGATESASDVIAEGSPVAFHPPSMDTDWVLVLKQQKDPPLPVELNGFDAVQREGGVLLKWTTLSETNNAGFAVERLVEDGRFEELAFVAGHGTSQVIRHYTFTDDQLPPAARDLAYRLRQVDTDGSFAYSPEVEVTLKTPTALSLFSNSPNPFRGETTIRYQVPRAGDVQLTLYDILGREVRRLVDAHHTAGIHEVTLSGDGLTGGIYITVLQMADARVTRRITLVR